MINIGVIHTVSLTLSSISMTLGQMQSAIIWHSHEINLPSSEGASISLLKMLVHRLDFLVKSLSSFAEMVNDEDEQLGSLLNVFAMEADSRTSSVRDSTHSYIHNPDGSYGELLGYLIAQMADNVFADPFRNLLSGMRLRHD